jgi:hypothetical protein
VNTSFAQDTRVCHRRVSVADSVVWVKCGPWPDYCVGIIARGQQGGMDSVRRAAHPLEPSGLLIGYGDKSTIASHVGVLMRETATTNWFPLAEKRQGARWAALDCPSRC